MDIDKNANVSFGLIKGVEYKFNHDGNIIKLCGDLKGKKRHYSLKTYLIVFGSCLLIGVLAGIILPAWMLSWPQILFVFLAVFIIVYLIFYITLASTGDGFVVEEIEVES